LAGLGGGMILSDTYLEATPSTAGIVMARWDEGSSLVTNFCINLALLRRMEARNLEKEPLRLVRPTHFGPVTKREKVVKVVGSQVRGQVEFEGRRGDFFFIQINRQPANKTWKIKLQSTIHPQARA